MMVKKEEKGGREGNKEVKSNNGNEVCFLATQHGTR
jgi:hypothetical protein